MKKKIVLSLLAALIMIPGVGLVYLKTAFPKVGKAPELKVEITPARLERGEYLARHVAACLDCHSTRDWSRYAGPILAGSEGVGGEKFALPFGDLYAPNITPSRLSNWTDGELYRAITAGVSKDGRPYFPLMPYLRYGAMDQEDLYSIIAFIRTLKPIEKEVPVSQLKFPMSFIVRTIPHEGTPAARPHEQVAYGRYLVGAAACADCHTPQQKGQPLPGMEMAGGMKFTLHDGSSVVSANLTPDDATGLGKWDEKRFVARFQSARTPAPAGHNTVMPWTVYAGMSEGDLAAIYAYLKTLAPVKK